ncbi:dihydrofolate reductase [Citrobacter phage Moon]|uniref:dihydrofolate reductase n=1 Tax=Citrobacter phage Moon TaxID=1540095 RepID=A0A0A0YQG2_9CAUD|nr:dihydrofolate reductase [Citrobacter phage Moon]AIX12226.1 dihydrofolate reductase [Citrobacter phage Moon]
MLQLVYAVSPTRSVKGQNELAFGLNDGLPWGHIKQDLQNFKARTKDTILIMGAKTFMGFAEPLPGRKSIVVQDMSRPLATAKNGFFADAYVSELEFAGFLGGDIMTAKTSYSQYVMFDHDKDYSVIGGIELIKKATPYADRIIQTTIRKNHRVNSTVQFPYATFWYPQEEATGFKLAETHWWAIDELTNISESVYVK